MALTLTAAQEEQIAKRRKPPGKKPKVFNKDTGKDEEISLDFEAYLILLGSDAKQSAANWIGALNDFSSIQGDRLAVLAQYLDVQFDSLAGRTTQLGEKIGFFEDFKQSVTQNLLISGSTLGEVQKMVADMAFLLGEYGEKLERSVNGQILNRMCNDRYVTGADFGPVRRELQSYSPALLAY
jgi:hypothetical protein